MFYFLNQYGKNGCCFLAHAETRFTSAESEQPETRSVPSVPSVPESSTVVYRLINNDILFIVYIDKHAHPVITSDTLL